MTFSFLHTGDLHIAKPYGRFDRETAGLLKAARLGVIERLGRIARAESVRHVLVAGDVYDHVHVSNKALLEPLERMKSAGDIAWHLIPGNHDPGEPGGIWERVLRSGLPENVFVHLEAKPVMLAADVVLLPSPILTKRLARDPTAWMAEASTGDGIARIGLAHGPVQTFGSGGYDAALIDPQRAVSAGLSYLALGDWHGTKQITERAWYAGTPEPDQFPDNEPGYTLLVTTDGAQGNVRVERRETARYIWQKRELVLRCGSDIEELVGEIEALGGRAHDMLLELSLSGEISLGDDQVVEACLDRLEARLFHLVRKSERLKLAPQDDEIEQLSDPGLKDVASRISLLPDGPEHVDRAVAERALRRLFSMARAAERDGP